MTRHKKKGHLITRELKNELVIVDTQNAQVHSLNQTAAMIWKMYNGKSSIDDMAQSILEKFEVPFETAKSDVKRILRCFIEKDLVNNPTQNSES